MTSPIRFPRGRRVPRAYDRLPKPDRVPAGDRLAGAPDPRRRRRAALAGGLVLLGLLALLPFLLFQSGDQRTSIRTSVLGENRRTHGPVCLDLVVDYSGSMQEVASIRDSALADLRAFIDLNLDPGDVLTMAAFAHEAVITLPPTTVKDLPPRRIAGTVPRDGRYTYLLPALESVRRAYAESSLTCAAHSLIVITDVELGDHPAALRDAFAGLRLQRVYWALPGGSDGDRPSKAAATELAGVLSRGFDDADTLGLVYGQAIASMTGQELRARP